MVFYLCNLTPTHDASPYVAVRAPETAVSNVCMSLL